MSMQAVSVPADHVVSLWIDNLTNDWTTYAVPFETPEKTRMVLLIRVKQANAIDNGVHEKAEKHRSIESAKGHPEIKNEASDASDDIVQVKVEGSQLTNESVGSDQIVHACRCRKLACATRSTLGTYPPRTGVHTYRMRCTDEGNAHDLRIGNKENEHPIKRQKM